MAITPNSNGSALEHRHIPPLHEDEDDRRWPQDNPISDGMKAFILTRMALRRAQAFLKHMRKHLTLPVGPFGDWENVRPTLDEARDDVETLRPAFVLLSPLRQKERYADLGKGSYHDRAIEAGMPLVEAFAKVDQQGWERMDHADRWQLVHDLPELMDGNSFGIMDLAYAEATRVAAWQKLSKAECRIVVAGSYACRRIDEICDVPMTDAARRELDLHMRSLVVVANDIDRLDIALEIEKAAGSPVGFSRTALFDYVKGVLITAIGKIIAPEDFAKRTYFRQDLISPGLRLQHAIEQHRTEQVAVSQPQSKEEGKVACSVQLCGEGQDITINGTKVDGLHGSDYSIIELLVQRFPKGYTKGQLEGQNFNEPHKRLSRIAHKSDLWATAIHSPGGAGKGGYRLNPLSTQST